MARASTYVNVNGNAGKPSASSERVWNLRGPIQRMGDRRDDPDVPALAAAEGHRVMHAELPVLAGHVRHDRASSVLTNNPRVPRRELVPRTRIFWPGPACLCVRAVLARQVVNPQHS